MSDIRTDLAAPSAGAISATLNSVSVTPARAEGVLSFYVRMWRRFPRDIGYIAFAAVLLPSLYLVLGLLLAAGVSTLTIVIGVFLLLATLWAARWLGKFELTRIFWAEPRSIRPVRWGPGVGTTAFGRAFSALGNPHYWLYLLHAAVLFPVVTLLSSIVTLIVIIGGIALIVDPFLPDGDRQLVWPVSVLLGVALLIVLPLVTRMFVRLHFAIDRLTLGGFRSEELELRVADLDASRGAAINAEGQSLRRLERDIHDGPQQRLVRLQMDLAAADRQLDADPQRARQLISEAVQHSRDALEELRALSRGFAPPILLDRGLVAALESAATRSPIPVTITSTHLDAEIPQEIERNAYFVASEALANAAKHSGATAIGLTVESIPQPAGTREDGYRWLEIVVTDDGRGNAVALPGHGLAGLAERLRGFGGTLEVTSPAGGPTVVTARFPIVG